MIKEVIELIVFVCINSLKLERTKYARTLVVKKPVFYLFIFYLFRPCMMLKKETELLDLEMLNKIQKNKCEFL